MAYDFSLDIEEAEAPELVEINTQIENGFEPVRPTQDQLIVYTQEIIAVMNNISVKTLKDCVMIQQALEALFIPGYKAILQTIDLNGNQIASLTPLVERVDTPQNFVLYPDHTDVYKNIVQNGVRIKLSKISIFSNHLRQKIEFFERNYVSISSAQQDVVDFFVQAYGFSRGQNILPEMEMTCILEKIRNEHISVDDIKKLSQEQINSLVFDGNSKEALSILEDLMQELRGASQAICF